MHPKKRNGRKGFTLVELMVIIVILGIIGTMGVLVLRDRPDEARWTRAEGEMNQIHSVLTDHYMRHREYPNNLDDIADNFPNRRVPRDPFSREPYIYEPGDRDFRLISYGADGVEGGTGVNADIIFTKDGRFEED